MTEWLCGRHAVAAVLESAPETVACLRVQVGKEPALAAVMAEAARHGVPVDTVSREALAALVTGKHQGVAARCQPLEPLAESALMPLLGKAPGPSLLLVLDGVTDPHNLGACLRTAEAAGVAAVLVPRDRSAGLTATVRQVASGAAERVPVVAVTNLARTLKRLQAADFWVAGATGDGDSSLYSLDMTGPWVWVLGAEGTGLRRLTREACDYRVAIPMAGRAESLNVSVAAGVCLFEAVRQRRGSTA